jgi:hypothetical protein
MQQLHHGSNTVSLRINIDKTKIMLNNSILQQRITSEDQEIENVDSFIYLGQKISIKEGQKEEINRMIQQCWMAYGKIFLKAISH